ncbi:MAG: hypothetical protein ACKPGJ_13090 [Dolichospermum sp.]
MVGCRLSINNVSLSITNYPLPITHYPLPITHYQFHKDHIHCFFKLNHHLSNINKWNKIVSQP